MSTNTKELSMKELEMVNGGMKLWKSLNYVFICAASGTLISGGIGSSAPVVGTVLGGALAAGIGAAFGSGMVLVKLYTED